MGKLASHPAAVQRRTLERGCRPFAYLKAVAGQPYPVLLESSQHDSNLGRYSLLFWAPCKKIEVRGETTFVTDFETGRRSVDCGSPFAVMSREFDTYRMPAPGGCDLPVIGGAVGFFSYDLRHRIELLPRACAYDVGLPDAVLCFYRQALVFDHKRQVTECVGPADTALPIQPLPSRSEGRQLPQVAGVRLCSNFAPEAYVGAVRRAKEYIAAGDIFQVNLSQRFSGLCRSDPLTLYQRLRTLNPAPFAAYMDYGDFQILSSSPERFLLLEGDAVTTRPIKGTRPRRETDETFNSHMREELLSSPKDMAELAMIVDLERNDLGRVCRYGSVRVMEHAALETYPTVYHLVSTVRGQLYRENHDEFSLIRATFPGGSITGAPKIRAMEIIEELEPHARSVYTGAIGYLSFHGRMDLNIVIRTVVKTGDTIHIQVGGGIVADSDPCMEFEETLHKGKALFQAVGASNYNEIMAGVAP